uniref:Uncharacterized protein n=1 Tax=Cannabis sativa TaxID=3483 RepID=A0A803PSK3_CANSA
MGFHGNSSNKALQEVVNQFYTSEVVSATLTSSTSFVVPSDVGSSIEDKAILFSNSTLGALSSMISTTASPLGFQNMNFELPHAPIMVSSIITAVDKMKVIEGFVNLGNAQISGSKGKGFIFSLIALHYEVRGPGANLPPKVIASAILGVKRFYTGKNTQVGGLC